MLGNGVGLAVDMERHGIALRHAGERLVLVAAETVLVCRARVVEHTPYFVR
jgi:hypothetical protein